MSEIPEHAINTGEENVGRRSYKFYLDIQNGKIYAVDEFGLVTSASIKWAGHGSPLEEARNSAIDWLLEKCRTSSP